MNPVLNSFLLVIILALSGDYSYAQDNKNIDEPIKKREVNMPAIETNKQVVRELFETCLNKKHMELLGNFVAEDFIGQQGKHGIDAFKEPVVALINAFPDIQWKVEDVIAEGNKVVVRSKWQGTHTQQFQFIPPTSKIISNEGIAVFEMKDNKIISSNVITDRLSFLQATEVLPFDLSSLQNKKTGEGNISLIDKFVVPSAAKEEFYKRMHINRSFIKNLPGFIKDAAYEYTNDSDNLVCVTVAEWQNIDALNKAKESVKEEYKKQNFNMAAMLERLNIVYERGIYTEVKGH